jgi:hypothetical protein
VKHQNGTGSKTALVGWAFLDRYRPGGITIRWRRGHPVAYVLSGQRVGDHGTANIVGTIPVHPAGWTDPSEIRLLAQRWHPQH